jgi:hypothetical protein
MRAPFPHSLPEQECNASLGLGTAGGSGSIPRSRIIAQTRLVPGCTTASSVLCLCTRDGHSGNQYPHAFPSLRTGRCSICRTWVCKYTADENISLHRGLPFIPPGISDVTSVARISYASPAFRLNKFAAKAGPRRHHQGLAARSRAARFSDIEALPTRALFANDGANR